MTLCADSSQLLWLCSGYHLRASTNHTNSNSKLLLPEKSSYKNTYYHMASSLRGQDQLNPALWLATPAGKMALSCLLWITHCVMQENSILVIIIYPFHKCFIDPACLVKMVGHWPHFFLPCLWTLPPSHALCLLHEKYYATEPKWKQQCQERFPSS